MTLNGFLNADLERHGSYSGSLLIEPEAGPVKSKQNALAPTLGTSLRFGVPERRLESVGRRHAPKPAFGQRV
jgi:hypothetical protein